MTPLPAGKGVCSLVASVVLAEAVAAVDGTVLARTEGDLGFCSAGGAGRVEHFALLVSPATAAAAAIVLLLAGRPALGAAAGFIGEALFGEEVLFGGGENEFGAAVAAGEGFVLIHIGWPPQMFYPNRDCRMLIGLPALRRSNENSLCSIGWALLLYPFPRGVSSKIWRYF